LITYVPIRTRSPYSISEGAIHLSDLANFAKEHGIPAVSIADTDSLAGAYSAKDALTKKGVQPIHSINMKISHPGLQSGIETSNIVLVATNHAGFLKISELSSEGALNQEPVKISSLANAAREETGFLMLTGGLEGPIDKAILAGSIDRAKQRLSSLKAIFGDRLYIEIQRQHGGEDATTLISFSKEMEIPCVATHEAWFLGQDMSHAHDVLMCIADGVTLNHTDRRHSDPNGFLLTPKQMADLFSDLPDAIANTLHLARRCNWFAEELTPVLPEFPTQAGRTESEELRAQSQDGLVKKLKDIQFDSEGRSRHGYKKNEYFERLEYELDVIEGMGFPGYFLIVSDFIKWSKDNDIPVGPGRGSGAGSLVAWVLTITDLDPLRYGLFFERFLNPERVSMPDFDIDFCQERRNEVIDYVRQKYGEDKVAQIGTLGKLQPRAVTLAVGRTMQIPYTVVDRFCQLIPNDAANFVSLSEAMESEPLQSTLQTAEQNIKDMFEVGKKLEGLFANASTHAAGVVIGDKPISQIVPVYRDSHGTVVTAFDMKAVEKASLVKFDFLGLKTLDIIKSTIDIAQRAGEKITLEQIGTEDPETYEMLRRGDAFGVFQLESAGMRKAMLQIQPTCIEDIIALVALYRPGPMENIPLYAAVKSGDEDAEYLHPDMEKTLSETHGIIVYQEQVMKLAQDLAGYTLGGADVLRRAMGKKIKSEMDKQRGVFLAGASKRNISSENAESIFNLIAKFANYGFNKSHAAAYAVISFQTAYLRRHHTEAFLAGSMNLNITEVDKIAEALENARRKNIATLPPDINSSKAHFDIEFIDGKKHVRHALASLRGVGMGHAEEIVKERETNGEFKSLSDLVDRCRSAINKKILESLIASGALDSLSLNRASMNAAVPDLLQDATRKKHDDQIGQSSLFDFESSMDIAPSAELPKIPDWDENEKLMKQFNKVGFFLDGHPISSIRSVLNRRRNSFYIKDLINPEYALPKEIRIGCIILDSIFKKTRSNKSMLILKVSDETAIAEALAFGDTVQEVREKIGKINGSVVTLVVGAAAEDDDVTLFIRDIEPLEI
jgi:DNA polymerase-3 subunit alpha